MQSNSESVWAESSLLEAILAIRGLPVARAAVCVCPRWAKIAQALIKDWARLRSLWSQRGVRDEREWIGHRTDDGDLGDFDTCDEGPVVVAAPAGGFVCLDQMECDPRMVSFQPGKNYTQEQALWPGYGHQVLMGEDELGGSERCIAVGSNGSTLFALEGCTVKRTADGVDFSALEEGEAEWESSDSELFVLGGQLLTAMSLAVSGGRVYAYVPSGVHGGWLVVLMEDTLDLVRVVEGLCAAETAPDREITVGRQGLLVNGSSHELFVADSSGNRILVYHTGDRLGTPVRQFDAFHERGQHDAFALALGYDDDLLVLSGNRIARCSLEGVLLQIATLVDWSPRSLCVGQGASVGMVFVGCGSKDDDLNVYGYGDESVHVMLLDNQPNNGPFTYTPPGQAVTAMGQVVPNSGAFHDFVWEVSGGNQYGFLGGDGEEFGPFESARMQRTIEHAWLSQEETVLVLARGENWIISLRGDSAMTAHKQSGRESLTVLQVRRRQCSKPDKAAFNLHS